MERREGGKDVGDVKAPGPVFLTPEKRKYEAALFAFLAVRHPQRRDGCASATRGWDTLTQAHVHVSVCYCCTDKYTFP